MNLQRKLAKAIVRGIQSVNTRSWLPVQARLSIFARVRCTNSNIYIKLLDTEMATTRFTDLFSVPERERHEFHRVSQS